LSRARPHLVTVGLACALWLLPGIASADWFDDYERGVAALAKGRPERAIPLLEKTIRRRPEPGSNLITYGTNRLKEYYPYLKLAEAHLALGNLDAAGQRSNARRRTAKSPRMPGQVCRRDGARRSKQRRPEPSRPRLQSSLRNQRPPRLRHRRRPWRREPEPSSCGASPRAVRAFWRTTAFSE